MKLDDGFGIYYPFAKLKNLIMVAGHSVYTSSSCEKADNEDSWFLDGIKVSRRALILLKGKRTDNLYILEVSTVTGKIGRPSFIMESKSTRLEWKYESRWRFV
ncbi:hypothetical protein Gotri_000878, partial [Gossypium trilobum]|nr:hypothetical protein [Gossypium trilobum]